MEARGTMTVEVTGDIDGTVVSARVLFQNETSVLAGPMEVGSGSSDPCERKPCSSAFQSYNDAAIAALETEGPAQMLYVRVRGLKAVVAALTGVELLLIGAIVACHALYRVAVVCVTLYAALTMVAIALVSMMGMLVYRHRQLLRAQADCRRATTMMRIRHLEMRTACPRECWLPEYEVDCEYKV